MNTLYRRKGLCLVIKYLVLTSQPAARPTAVSEKLQC
jgi:hypothetical protein